MKYACNDYQIRIVVSAFVLLAEFVRYDNRFSAYKIMFSKCTSDMIRGERMSSKNLTSAEQKL